MSKLSGKEFFEKSTAAILDAVDTWDAATNKKMDKVYRDMYKEVVSEIMAILQRYGNGDEVTFEMVNKLGRLERIEKQIYEILDKYAKQEAELIREMLSEYFKESVELQTHALSEFVGEKMRHTFNEKAVNMAINFPWDAYNFDKRIRESKRRLAWSLNEIIVNGLIHGKSIHKMTKELSDKVQMSRRRAETVIRTESSRILNMATLHTYEQNKVTKVGWIVGPEKNRQSPCSDCKQHKGKTFDLDKVPTIPVHPNCRCAVYPVEILVNGKKEKI